MSKHYHNFHIVDASPWPYVGSMGALGLTAGTVSWMHGYKLGGIMMEISLLLIILVMITWWRDVIREGTYQGHHTLIVQRGLRYGMLLFILSEVCFFFGFFWAFFHSALAPTVTIGTTWPPVGINALDALEVPLLNTVILLSSGATATWSHHGLINGNKKEALLGLSITIVLGLIFSVLQGLEYYEAPFTIADSVYGSTFYVATGFHGLHVLIGTTFLIVCLWRISENHFTKHHHNGFEAALWYWHFVDVVWIFLYVCIYYWGS